MILPVDRTLPRSTPAFTHDWIWSAIDALAVKNKLSPSGLARLAGLDPTAFNRSKRFTQEGRPRWPSTESIAKILVATKTSLDEFADHHPAAGEALSLADDLGPGTPPVALDAVPVVGEILGAEVREFSQATVLPSKVVPFSLPSRQGLFAVTVSDGSLEPVYSAGNTLIASKLEPTRVGDRVVVKPLAAPAMPRLLLEQAADHVEFGAFGAGASVVVLPRRSIDWIARIIWARQ